MLKVQFTWRVNVGVYESTEINAKYMRVQRRSVAVSVVLLSSGVDHCKDRLYYFEKSYILEGQGGVSLARLLPWVVPTLQVHSLLGLYCTGDETDNRAFFTCTILGPACFAQRLHYHCGFVFIAQSSSVEDQVTAVRHTSESWRF